MDYNIGKILFRRNINKWQVLVKRILELRKQFNLSQKELAEKTGLLLEASLSTMMRII